MSFELTLSEIVQACNGILLAGSESQSVKKFSIDSRKISPGDCFIALRGRRFDGHNFILQALEEGAEGVILEAGVLKALPEKEGCFFIEVRDTYQAIYHLARYKRRKMDFQILAITGSNGKTTIKELSAEFLNSKYPTCRNYLNQNNLLGVSLNLLNCSQTYKFAVFEIGISEIGEMEAILEILQPEHGLIANIGPAHLEFLGGLDKVYQEKLKLFESLNFGSYAFYSLDDEYLSGLKREKFKCRNFVTFGFLPENDYSAQLSTNRLEGIELDIRGMGNLSSSLLGRQNAFNILAAVAVASEFGVGFKEIREVLAEFRPLPGRMNYFSISGLDIIEDCYNSNPRSLILALEFVSSLSYPGVKIAILGDMLELGEESGRWHYSCGAEARNFELDYYLCYGEEMRHFRQGLLEGGFPAGKVSHCEPAEAPARLLELLADKERTLLLFKASRGMKAELILEELLNQLRIRDAL